MTMSEWTPYKNGRRTLSLNGPGWRKRDLGELIMPGDYWLHGGRWYTRIDQTYIDDLGWTRVGDANVPSPIWTQQPPSNKETSQ